MPLIRNENAIPTRRGFSGALFSALLALALFDPSAATAQKHKQIKLTEKHIQGFMGAHRYRLLRPALRSRRLRTNPRRAPGEVASLKGTTRSLCPNDAAAFPCIAAVR